MKIIEYPLTDIFYIIVFEGRRNAHYRISRDENMLDGTQSLCTGFMNRSDLSLSRKELVGNVGNLSEEIVIDLFNRAGIENPYINYLEGGKDLTSALDSLQTYLELQGWDVDLDYTYLVAPKKSKELKGKKIPMEFDVGAKDFRYTYGKIIEVLDVYMTPITKKSKSVRFSVKIPKFIYDKAMTNTEIKERPVVNYIEGDTISYLHSRMDYWVGKCRGIYDLEKSAASASKFLYVMFVSGEGATRDSFNFAYTGQSINIRFKYYVAYKTSGGKMFTNQRLQSGSGAIDKGIKGLIGDDGDKEKYWISGGQQGIQLKWTQEKEDFLKRLEGQFRTLSDNLNKFLKDIDEEKLLGLMNDNIKLLN